MQPYQTMRATFGHICQGLDPWLPLGNFMNDWYDNYVEERAQLLLHTPPIEFARRNVFCGDRVYANKWELVEEVRLRYAPLLAERKRQAVIRRALVDKRRAGWRGAIARRIPATEQFLIGSRWQ